MAWFLACFCFGGVAFAQTPVEYRIGPGDKIDLKVHNAELSSEGLVVAPDGTVSVPYVGDVLLAGKTTREAAEHVRVTLEDGYLVNPEVSVRVSQHTSQRIELFGAFAKPGIVSLTGQTTLRSVVAGAGGVQADKSTGFITITRGDERITKRVSELNGEAGDFLLLGGDVVDALVGNTIFLAGEVANPGSVTYNTGLTASQALLMAGGHTQFGRLAGAYIVRGDERIQVNLKRVLKGKAADIELRPGDRMIIPVSPI